MFSHPQYAEYTYTIEPGGSATISRDGEFFTLLESVSPIKISFDDAPRTLFRQGLVYDAQVPFKTVRMENPTGSTVGVTIGIGRGGIKDNRFVAAGRIETYQASPPNAEALALVNIGSGQVVQIVASDLRRKEALFQNQSASQSLWLRSDAVAAPGGILVPPLGAAGLTTSAAIYGFNPGDNALDVSGMIMSEDV